MPQTSVPTVIREADRCVKCGLCLPECPTYRIGQDENESPRGRIALIEALARGQLAAEGHLTAHLDHCLVCRRCERICPSQVRYGYLIDEARHLLAADKRPAWKAWLQDPDKLRLATRLAHLLPSALSRPFGRLNRMHRLARALPPSGSAPRPGEYVAGRDPARGRVALFLGCATAAQQGGALQAALRLLRHAGFTTLVAESAGCCGALPQHAGDPRAAARLATANRVAFDDNLDAVVSIASGCGIHLDSYAPALPVRHYDIHRFLLEFGRFTQEDFRPMEGRAMLHTPCSMENVYRGGDWPRGLLALIPGLTVSAVGETGQCCGSAGDYMLRHPAIAERLRRPILDQAIADGAGTLLTSNIGCALHLAEGLHAQRGSIEVLHPVELLARQLRE